MSKRFKRSLAYTAALVLIVMVLTAAGGWMWWRTSLPPLSGSVALPGLAQPARVIRDANGIPHIFADNLNDAWRAAGYVHAQDRLFQMDLQRRVMQGRLAEVTGTDGLSYDKLFRTLDLKGVAEANLEGLSPEARAGLEAYADGVNAWLRDVRTLPAEYKVLGMTPEPWRPADSLLWAKAMAWKLSGYWRDDALRGKLAAKLPRDEIEQLFVHPGPNDPVTLKPRAQKQARASETLPSRLPPEVAPVLRQLAELPWTGVGASNEWVVSGARSETGKPLLANDPHLELQLPVLWYLLRITTPDMTLAGATAPGAPGLLLGQNGHIAWGFTATETDTQDLFVEKPDPNDFGRYLTPEGSEPFISRLEYIKVKDGPPFALTIRKTRHGPVLSDISTLARAGQDDTPIVAMSWTGFDSRDTTAEAMMRLNIARNWQEFREALRLYHAPTQNIVYADTAGHIGYFHAGAVPVRKAGDGRYPADGASGAFDWTGTVPFESWPQMSDPPEGVIVNANNMSAAPDYPYHLGYDREPGYRAARIAELLDAQPRHSLDSLAAMQMDSLAVHARVLLPLLLQTPAADGASSGQKAGDAKAAPMPEGASSESKTGDAKASLGKDERERQALAMLKAWDMMAKADRAEPLIFEWWLSELGERLLTGKWSGSAIGDAPVIANILRNPQGFCPANERGDPDCAGPVADALTKALADLTTRHGRDMTAWRWGDEHVTTWPNLVLDHVPGYRTLFNYRYGADGGDYSVNRGGNNGHSPEALPLARETGAGYRGVYDLAAPENSRFSIATGQSGHPLSRFFANLMPLWRDGKGVRLVLPEAEVMKGNAGVMEFRP